MKVLLAAPPFEDEWREPISKNAHYPLGIVYLHSYLEECGHTVESLFLNSHDYSAADEIFRRKIETFAPDIVGLNILTSSRVCAYNFIEYIQNHYPDVRIIIGGIHTSTMYEQILQKYPKIIAVVGEGEIVTANLLTALESGADLQDIKGIAYTVDSTTPDRHSVKVTEKEKLIKDLDTLPFPKHDIFFQEDRTTACILTSRGCPFQCSYCVLGIVSDRMVRYRSIENVMSEIEYLVEKYPQIDTFWIHDDVFFLKPRRVIEFCNEYVKRNIKRKIICSGRFKPFSSDMAHALERAGVEVMLFGLETGSNTLMETSHKSMQQKDILSTFNMIKDVKVEPICFLIVGLPGENDQTVAETISFVKKMQKIRYFHYSDIGTLTIYPGTEVYDIAKAKGAIDDDYWLGDGPAPLYTAEHSLEQLNAYKNQILNAVALDRIFTIKGFISQVDMIPYIIKSIIKGTPHYRKEVISLLIKALSPALYLRVQRLYRRSKTS